MAASPLSNLLPDAVAVVAVAGNYQPNPLLPAEQIAIADAAPMRRLEFARGRYCAHQALLRLGAPATPILVGRQREPLWPDGFVGSITHCEGFVAAAVAQKHEIRCLGIDAELARPLPAEVVPSVCLPLEFSAADLEPALWATILFSAKESIYKCTFPSTQRFLEFSDVQVFLHAEGLFSSSSGVVDLRGINGRYAISDTYLFTAAWANGSRPEHTALWAHTTPSR